jgi:ribosomal protein L29
MVKITKQFQELSEEELKVRLIEFKKELFKFNSQRASGTNPENPGKVGQTRKNIARILTILNQKEKQLSE